MTTAFRRVIIKRGAKDQSKLPKFWRKKVTSTQQVDCQVIHWDLITRFTDGSADSADLWDWIETGLTYAKMAQLLQSDGVEFTTEAMDALSNQLGTYTEIIERYRRTQRVAFSGTEYTIAKDAASVMDSLIAMDRNGIAALAGYWAIDQIAKLQKTALRNNVLKTPSR